MIRSTTKNIDKNCINSNSNSDGIDKSVEREEKFDFIDIKDISKRFLKVGAGSQFLFKIEAKDKMDKYADTNPELGQLHIRWGSTFGENGLLKTPVVMRKLPPRQEIDVQFLGIKSQSFRLRKSFEIQCKVINRGNNAMTLRAECSPSQMSGIKVHGRASQHLGVVASRSSITFKICLIPLQKGLHAINGIFIVDCDSKRRFMCHNPDVVLVGD